MKDLTKYTATEQEIIVLFAAWEMIDDMVNYQMFTRNSRVEDVTLLFETSVHQQLFNILIVDFLSKPTKSRNSPSMPFGLQEASGYKKTDHTILFYLNMLCAMPQLNADSSKLMVPVNRFVEWLEGDCQVQKVYLPSIPFNGDLKMKRIEFIKICGNIAKHNFLRLEENIKQLNDIFVANDIEVDRGRLYLVLKEFYEWFHDDIFNYHGTTMAELLNNVRWGIYEYLSVEFARSFELISKDPWMYKFNYPSSCIDPIVRNIYWDLMNYMLREPYFPKFTTSKWLKLRY